MLDLAFAAYLAGLLLLGLRRPFIWVLAYLYVDIVAPQMISWGFLSSLPISLIVFLAAFGGWLVLDDKQESRFNYRQGLLLLLLGYCAFTTYSADFHEEALGKWEWVWKALVFAIFLPLTLRTRLRIEAAALVMVLSAAAIIVSGGIKTAMGGGGYGTLRLLVDNNTGLYEGSIISCVAIAIIPLILWLVKHGTIYVPDWRVKAFAAGLILACILMPIGTQARTGLVCFGFLCVLLLRSAKRRLLYFGLMGAVGLLSIPFLPQSFTDRMSTIENHQSDQSASTRIAVWKWTLDYVKHNPMGGGFEAYLANKLEYKTVSAETAGSTTIVRSEDVEDAGRAYHSAYFEMLGEQGFPGLILWLWIQASGLWHMERIRRRWKDRTGQDEQWQAPLANALQQSHLVYLLGSLFVGIAFQPFMLMLIGLQCALWTYLKRIDGSTQEAMRKRRKPKPLIVKPAV
ncbi:MAG: putative O-glycosylation ligase, exosortase A system-associated [Novosphingobium sp.]|nr:putative O-glycosylation ligase, exosortase A system-associated [Novosphingobium sp.]